jgi:hypothetical protein
MRLICVSGGEQGTVQNDESTHHSISVKRMLAGKMLGEKWALMSL